jgi:peroxiredoxin
MRFAIFRPSPYLWVKIETYDKKNMKAIIGFLAAAMIMACNNTGQLSTTPTTKADSVSYAIGQDLGKNFENQSIGVNPEAFLAGLKAKAEGDTPLLDEAQAQAVIMQLQQEMQQKQMAQMQQQQQQQQQSATTGDVSRAGQEAPEITLPTPEGGEMSLSDLRGKVVLIDFWASWCKPCRAENPRVVQMYNQYKDQGFEIFGVSLDRTKDAWVTAIEKDGLEWPHVSDLKFWQSAAAQAYGVSAIPHTVLLDRNGKIVAEKLRGPALEAKVASLLGS